MLDGLLSRASQVLRGESKGGLMGQTSSQEKGESDMPGMASRLSSETFQRMRRDSKSLPHPPSVHEGKLEEEEMEQVGSALHEVKQEMAETAIEPFVEREITFTAEKSKRKKKKKKYRNKTKRGNQADGITAVLKYEIEETPAGPFTEENIVSSPIESKKERKKSKKKKRKSQKRRGIFDIPLTPGPHQSEDEIALSQTLVLPASEARETSSHSTQFESSGAEAHAPAHQDDVSHWRSDPNDFGVVDWAISAPPPSHPLDDLPSDEEPAVSEIVSSPQVSKRDSPPVDSLSAQDEEFPISPPLDALAELPHGNGDFTKSTTPSIDGEEPFTPSRLVSLPNSSRPGTSTMLMVAVPSRLSKKNKGKGKEVSQDHFLLSQEEESLGESKEPDSTSRSKKKTQKKAGMTQVIAENPFEKAIINARIRAEEEREKASRRYSSSSQPRISDGASLTSRNGSPLIIANGVSKVLTRRKRTRKVASSSQTKLTFAKVEAMDGVLEGLDDAGRRQSSDDSHSLIAGLSKHQRIDPQTAREDSIVRPPEESGQDRASHHTLEMQVLTSKGKKRKRETASQPERSVKRALKDSNRRKPKAFKSNAFILDSDTDLDTQNSIRAATIPGMRQETSPPAVGTSKNIVSTALKKGAAAKRLQPQEEGSPEDGEPRTEYNNSQQPVATRLRKRRQLPVTLGSPNEHLIESLRPKPKKPKKPTNEFLFDRKAQDLDDSDIRPRNSTASGGPRVNGPFSEVERGRLNEFKRRYCSKNDCSSEDFITLIHANARDNAVFWNEAAEAVPDRDRVAIQKFCRRAWNRAPIRGKFDKSEDEELLRLVKKYKTGNQILWKQIGIEMDRMPEDLRDHWRNVLKDDERSRDSWTLAEVEALKRAVGECGAEILDAKQAKDNLVESRSRKIEGLIVWSLVSEKMGGKRGRAQCNYKWKALKKKGAVSLTEEIKNANRQLGLGLILPSSRKSGLSTHASSSAVEDMPRKSSQPDFDETEDGDDQAEPATEPEMESEVGEYAAPRKVNASGRKRRRKSSSILTNGTGKAVKTDSESVGHTEPEKYVKRDHPKKKARKDSAPESRRSSPRAYESSGPDGDDDSSEETDQEANEHTNSFIDDEVSEGDTSEVEDESEEESDEDEEDV